MTIKQRVYEVLEVGAPGDKLSRAVDTFIIVLIFLNIIAIVLHSVKTIAHPEQVILPYFNVFSVIVFTVEYGLRVWCITANPQYAHPLWGRLRYAMTPLALIDLLAVLPFYLPLVDTDLRFIRAWRLLRLIRVAKLVRYSHALRLLGGVFYHKRDELTASMLVLFLLMLFSACMMYQLEKDAQPEKFANIPEAMWWSVATLTTVGYGDVYPITIGGKILASVIVIMGIGLFATTTGIVAMGFVEELQRRKKGHYCPHCGKDINKKPMPGQELSTTPDLLETTDAGTIEGEVGSPQS